MKTQNALTYAQVRQAGLTAKVELHHVTYEYRPLDGAVVVQIRSHRQPALATTSRIPQDGWMHAGGCACRFCLVAEKTDAATEQTQTERRRRSAASNAPGAGAAEPPS